MDAIRPADNSGEEPGAREADLIDRVDTHPGVHRATEHDEERVLAQYYGEPDHLGCYGTVHMLGDS